MRSAIPLRWVVILLLISALPSVSIHGKDGDTAPDFQLSDLGNKVVSLHELLEDGPVLLDFWATWCSPCLKSMPLLEQLHLQYGEQGLSVVGINVDGPRSRSKIKPFIRSRRITFPHLIDRNGDVMRLFGVQAIPTSILIAKDGTIIRRRLAAEVGDHKALENAIRKALE
jgi:thiol-disulfide isomerase/thioredoxin